MGIITTSEEAFKQRFMSHVQKSPSGCWLWVGAKDHHGWGLVTPTEIIEMQRLRSLGWTYEKIAKQVGRGVASVSKYSKSKPSKRYGHGT